MATEEQKKVAQVEEKEEELPELEEQNDTSKLNRGEKKCRKALLKVGMKQQEGVTRITLKKRDGLLFVIKTPEVLVSGESQFCVFGELQLEDPNSRLAQTEANKFVKDPAVTADSTEKKDDKKEEKEDDNEEALSEEGLTPNHITMVMEHSGCSRNKAIKALREANDDMVNAVLKLTQ